MDKQAILLYLHKLASGTCSAEDQVAFDKWVQETDTLQYKEILLLWEQINDEKENFEQPEASFLKKIQSDLDKVQKVRFYKWVAVAASIIICVGTGLYIYQRKAKDLVENNQWARNDIAPGKNKAILKIGGRTINLSDAVNGNLVNQAGFTITKTKDGQLIYSVRDSGSGVGNKMSLNVITTPKGGQWQINLADGTRVWLNAASSLKFPAKFASNERRVILDGEAYFVVKHNAKQPFRVETKGQVVEDIGTEFNIKAYTDESTTKTTLIEGAARIVAAVTLSLSKGVLRHPSTSSGQHDIGQAQGDIEQVQGSNSVVLKPNQQSMLTNTGAINVIRVDAESEAAWKNGDFVFTEEPLESIMRKISRWYNVEINYNQDAQGLKTLKFGGLVSRAKNISAVLQIIENTGQVKFKIEERRVTVMK